MTMCPPGVGSTEERCAVQNAGPRGHGDGHAPLTWRLIPAVQRHGQHRYVVLPDTSHLTAHTCCPTPWITQVCCTSWHLSPDGSYLLSNAMDNTGMLYFLTPLTWRLIPAVQRHGQHRYVVLPDSSHLTAHTCCPTPWTTQVCCTSWHHSPDGSYLLSTAMDNTGMLYFLTPLTWRLIPAVQRHGQHRYVVLPDSSHLTAHTCCPTPWTTQVCCSSWHTHICDAIALYTLSVLHDISSLK